MKAADLLDRLVGYAAGLLCGGLLWCALYLGLTWTRSAIDRAANPADYVTAPDAYILVHPYAATSLWDYQQLPMKDCAWCHRTVNLNRHHIIPQAANPALRDVRENLVVLCRDCHFVLGHRCDWKQYNPDVMYICAHFTNCVQSADTRRSLTPEPAAPDCADWGHVSPAQPAIDASPILHVTNDVPERQKSALERILKWNPEEQIQ